MDTNVLLRTMISDMALHEESEALIQRMLANQIELWISRQVLREYLVQVTHPRTFARPLELELILKQMDEIQAVFQIADDTHEVTVHLLSLLQTYPTRGKQIHDANIVATMLAYRIDILLTINIEDLRRFENIITLISPTA